MAWKLNTSRWKRSNSDISRGWSRSEKGAATGNGRIWEEYEQNERGQGAATADKAGWDEGGASEEDGRDEARLSAEDGRDERGYGEDEEGNEWKRDDGHIYILLLIQFILYLKTKSDEI